MEQENFDNSNERPIESVYSTRIRAGKDVLIFLTLEPPVQMIIS